MFLKKVLRIGIVLLIGRNGFEIGLLLVLVSFFTWSCSLPTRDCRLNGRRPGIRRPAWSNGVLCSKCLKPRSDGRHYKRRGFRPFAFWQNLHGQPCWTPIAGGTGRNRRRQNCRRAAWRRRSVCSCFGSLDHGATIVLAPTTSCLFPILLQL